MTKLFVSIVGTELTPQETTMLTHDRIAGVILFSNNISNKRNLTQLVKTIHEIRSTLLIAIDQEGGTVRRLRGSEYYDAPSQKDQPPDVESCAKQIAWDLKSIGIDLNCAPVVDLDVETSPIIGQRGRAYPGSIEEVTTHAKKAAHEFLKKGIIPCLKHFPGHGRVNADSHHSLPTDDRTQAEIYQDCLPYRSIPNVPIMMAHLESKHYQGITTFSKQAVIDARAGSDRLILTDCMSMGAISTLPNISPTQAVLKACESGVDGIIYAHQSPEQILTLLNRLPEITEETQLRWRNIKNILPGYIERAAKEDRYCCSIL